MLSAAHVATFRTDFRLVCTWPAAASGICLLVPETSRASSLLSCMLMCYPSQSQSRTFSRASRHLGTYGVHWLLAFHISALASHTLILHTPSPYSFPKHSVSTRLGPPPPLFTTYCGRSGWQSTVVPNIPTPPRIGARRTQGDSATCARW